MTILFFAFAGKSYGQAEVPHLASAPATCDATRGQIYYDTTLKALQVCTATNTWTSSSSASSPAQFNVMTYGAVYDDSTDNCTAFTNLAAASNAYSGSGTPSVSLAPPVGTTGKAYKLTSCNIAFTVPTAVDGGGATIDCGNSNSNCIQVGPSGLAAFSNAQLPRYSVKNLTMIGGASLTTAGIEVEPFISQVQIHDINFTNFGAGNATSGNCTNWGIQFDGHNNEIGVHTINWWSFDATANRCPINNGSDGGTGSNTGQFFNLHLLATAAPGFSSPCGSQGIVLGGTASQLSNSSIYGFGIPIRVQNPNIAGNNGGVNITIGPNNDLDNAGCSAKGVSAIIHYGAPSQSATIKSLSVIGNHDAGGAGDTLLAQAGDSTETLTDALIAQNVAPNGLTVALVPAAATCLGICTAVNNQNFTTAPVTFRFTRPDQIIGGTTFTVTGCSATSPTGGATAGFFKSGVTGTCTPQVTFGNSLASSGAGGWACDVHDQTTPANFIGESSWTATTVTFTGTTTTNDTIVFSCRAF